VRACSAVPHFVLFGTVRSWGNPKYYSSVPSVSRSEKK
jgi:hypothetical protein